MNILKLAGIVLVTLVLVFVGGGVLLPSGYRVERSERVQAPLEITFAQVNELRNWEQWSPWSAADSSMQITYGATTVGEGAEYTWTGDQSGEGTLTITASIPGERVDTLMDFGEMGSAKGYWNFSHQAGVTSVTWGFSGENPGIMGSWLSLMMDSMVGPQFENGLRSLKRVAESTPFSSGGGVQRENSPKTEGQSLPDSNGSPAPDSVVPEAGNQPSK